MGFWDYAKQYSGYNAGKKALQGDFKGAFNNLEQNDVGGSLLNLPHLSDDPKKVDTEELGGVKDDAFGLQKALGGERAGYRGAYSPDQRAALDGRAQGSLDALAAAAGLEFVPDEPGAATGASLVGGQSPHGGGSVGPGGVRGTYRPANTGYVSAAELALQRETARAQQNALGNAAAFQGRSPARAMRMAALGASDAAATAIANGAKLRAAEQAEARGQLASAIQGQQGVLQNYRGQDINEKGQLLQGELGALDAGVKATTSKYDAESKNAAAENARDASILGAGIGALGKLSDERAKTSIKSAPLDDLAKQISAITFEYKDPANGDGPELGVRAQDVERGGKLGRGMVHEGRDGLKRVDLGAAINAALAMSAEAMKRTRKTA